MSSLPFRHRFSPHCPHDWFYSWVCWVNKREISTRCSVCADSDWKGTCHPAILLPLFSSLRFTKWKELIIRQKCITGRWIEVEIIMLGELSQDQRIKYHMFWFHLWNLVLK
jgi:hypothetical protein